MVNWNLSVMYCEQTVSHLSLYARQHGNGGGVGSGVGPAGDDAYVCAYVCMHVGWLAAYVLARTIHMCAIV
jgi:hypothetical protein